MGPSLFPGVFTWDLLAFVAGTCGGEVIVSVYRARELGYSAIVDEPSPTVPVGMDILDNHRSYISAPWTGPTFGVLLLTLSQVPAFPCVY